MVIFKSRYLLFIKDLSTVKVVFRSNYAKIIVVISSLIILSILFIREANRGLIIQLSFTYSFIGLVLFGLTNSYLSYPIIFTETHLVYKGFSFSDFKSFRKELSYTDVDSIKLVKSEKTKGKWLLEVFYQQKRIIDILLYVENEQQLNEILYVKRSLEELGVPFSN